MANVLKAAGANVFCTDIEQRELPLNAQFDFLSDCDPKQFSFDWGLSLSRFDWLISNPPFGPRCNFITPFIKAGLSRLGPNGGLALLLPVDCDSAKGRKPYFNDCAEFDAKVTLTKRIVWFERTDGGDESPKENHAWFLWRRSRQSGPRRILYAPILGDTPVKTAA